MTIYGERHLFRWLPCVKGAVAERLRDCFRLTLFFYNPSVTASRATSLYTREALLSYCIFGMRKRPPYVEANDFASLIMTVLRFRFLNLGEIEVGKVDAIARGADDVFAKFDYFDFCSFIIVLHNEYSLLYIYFLFIVGFCTFAIEVKRADKCGEVCILTVLTAEISVCTHRECLAECRTVLLYGDGNHLVKFVC